MNDHWDTIEDALTDWRSTLEFDEERMHVDAALAFVREQRNAERTPQQGRRWEPVEDGTYGVGTTVTVRGALLEIENRLDNPAKAHVMFGGDHDWRLCRWQEGE